MDNDDISEEEMTDDEYFWDPDQLVGDVQFVKGLLWGVVFAAFLWGIMILFLVWIF